MPAFQRWGDRAGDGHGDPQLWSGAAERRAIPGYTAIEKGLTLARYLPCSEFLLSSKSSYPTSAPIARRSQRLIWGGPAGILPCARIWKPGEGYRELPRPKKGQKGK